MRTYLTLAHIHAKFTILRNSNNSLRQNNEISVPNVMYAVNFPLLHVFVLVLQLKGHNFSLRVTHFFFSK